MIFSDFPFSSIFNKPAIWGSFIFRNPKKPTDIHRDEIPAKPRVLSKSSTCTDFNTWPLLGGVIYPAWWTYKKRTGSHGPNRNRWFTVLKNGGSFHGYVSHNQRVIWFNIWVIYKVERLNYVTSSCLGWFRYDFPLPAQITGSSIPWDIQKLEVCLLVKITLLVLGREWMGMGLMGWLY